MTIFYATTRFFQDDQEFECTWDLNATKENPTEEETIRHFAEMFEENFPETWNLDEVENDEDNEEEEDNDDSTPTSLNLFGLSPYDFATELVLHETESKSRFGITWAVSTRWEQVDADCWEHPCDL